jgi:hypothetical protein
MRTTILFVQNPSIVAGMQAAIKAGPIMVTTTTITDGTTTNKTMPERVLVCRALDAL